MFKTLDLENLHPFIRPRINKRARRLALRLDVKDRVVNLTIPPRARPRDIEKFVNKHIPWVEDKISALPAKVSFVNGAIVPLFGKDHQINITFDKTLKTTDIYIENKQIIIKTKSNNPETRLLRFLKKLAKEKFDDLAHEKASRIGKTIKTIEVRDTKSRWGSCSHDGRISLSWRLILAPYTSMDYVIAHEVAHLKHMDHSPKFWETCEDLCEDYKNGKAWMRKNSAILLQYAG